MLADPQEHDVIPVAPGSSALLSEEDPWVATFALIHHQTHALGFRLSPAVCMVFLPNLCLEPLPAGVGNRDVWEEVVVVEAGKRVSETNPEGVLNRGGDDVVGEGATASVGDPDWVVEERS